MEKIEKLEKIIKKYYVARITMWIDAKIWQKIDNKNRS